MAEETLLSPASRTLDRWLTKGKAFWRRRSVEHKLFLVTCGCGELLAWLAALENLAVNALVLATCLGAAAIYLGLAALYLWKRAALKVLVSLLSISLLAIMWLFNSGFEGGAQYFIIFAFIGALVLLRGPALAAVLFLDSLVVLGLFFLEYQFPDLTTKYADRTSRYIDLVLSFGTSMSVLLVSLSVVLHILTRVHQESEKKSDELRDARDRLEALGFLAAQVGHELNTPNHVISLNAVLLESLHKQVREDRQRAQEDGLEDIQIDGRLQEAAPLVRSILKASGQISQIVADLRLQVRTQGTPERLDLTSLVRQTVQLYEVRWRQETNRLLVIVPEGQVWVEGVEFRLQQLLVNLVTNSLRALPDKDSSVVLSVETEGTTAILAVTDEGEGMTEEVQAQLGTTFFTTHSSKEGTGFGWRLCQEIVREHRGQLLVTSHPGEGTRVEVRFPAV